MATSRLTNTAKDPNGTAAAGVSVTARLRPGPGFRSSDSSEITPVESTTSDAAGAWELTLERTGDITPSGSWWEIEEAFGDSHGGPRVWAVTVGAVDATLLASLLTAPPPGPTPSQYLTQVAGDARYFPFTGAPASSVAFTPTGGVAATTVQAAIAEVDAEKETPAGAQAKVDAETTARIAADAAHAGAADPHIGYRLESVLLADADIAPAAAIAKSKLAPLVIVDADVAAAAAIAEAKLALASDAAAATPSRRTLGTGALQALPGNHASTTDARTPLAHKATHEVGGSDPFTGAVPGQLFVPSGLTGAVAASRYVGATAGGKPTSGTFAVGDYIIDRAGYIWICTVAGSPGTWVSPARGELPGGYAQVVTSQGSITTEADLTGLSVTVTVGVGRLIRVSALVKVSNDTAGGRSVVYIKEGAAYLTDVLDFYHPIASSTHRNSGAVRPSAPSAGAHTYKLTAQSLGGTTTLSASSTGPASILVEDIGGV